MVFGQPKLTISRYVIEKGSKKSYQPSLINNHAKAVMVFLNPAKRKNEKQHVLRVQQKTQDR